MPEAEYFFPAPDFEPVRIDDLTREQAIEAVRYLAGELRDAHERHADRLKILQLAAAARATASVEITEYPAG